MARSPQKWEDQMLWLANSDTWNSHPFLDTTLSGFSATGLVQETQNEKEWRCLLPSPPWLCGGNYESTVPCSVSTSPIQKDVLPKLGKQEATWWHHHLHKVAQSWATRKIPEPKVPSLILFPSHHFFPCPRVQSNQDKPTFATLQGACGQKGWFKTAF